MSTIRPMKAEILDAELCDAILEAYDYERSAALQETRAREQESGRAWLLCGCGRVRR